MPTAGEPPNEPAPEKVPAVGMRELARETRRIIDEVASGKPRLVTDRGHIRAIIQPVDERAVLETVLERVGRPPSVHTMSEAELDAEVARRRAQPGD